MSDRVLTWHAPDRVGDGARIGPAHYLEADYAPMAVHLQVEIAARELDAEVDILKDGVSIFANRTVVIRADASTKGPTTSRGAAQTTAVLVKGDTEGLGEDSFVTGLTLGKGSWITCIVKKYGDARNLSVNLELEEVGG